MNFHQNEVNRWHSNTFPERRPLPTAKKILEEASELHIAVKENTGHVLNPSKNVVQEIADVIIAALGLASIYQINVSALVLERLEELKLRTNQPERDRERGIE